jgi:TPR repeat protein
MSGSPDKDVAPASGHAEEPDEGVPPGDGALDMGTLRARGDADGLLELARAYRAGTGGMPRDLPKCLACYREAAKLGSAEAEYSVALFYLSGGVVVQDLKEGAARLRAAADGGYLPAKVYLANLYELGVHFAADSAKADVWYRSAARAADVTADAQSLEYAKAMADLGCARYCLALAEDEAIPEAERERLLKKAKAYGYQLALRRDSRASAAPARDSGGPTETPVAAEAQPANDEPTEEPPSRQAAKVAKVAKVSEKTPAPVIKKATEKGTVGAALAAFFYATLFVAGSVAAGYFLTFGAAELLHRGVNLPLLAEHPRVLFPVVVLLFGVLPALLMYKAMTVVRALGVGALLAGGGYALWGAPQATLVPDKELQALLLGVAGFLAALLVLGLWGGIKPKRKPPPRILT